MQNQEYILEDASSFIYLRSDSGLKLKYSTDDILQILLLEQEYMDLIGLTSGKYHDIIKIPCTEIDEQELVKFIHTNAPQYELYTTEKDLELILNEEMEYMSSIGFIDDESAYNN